MPKAPKRTTIGMALAKMPYVLKSFIKQYIKNKLIYELKNSKKDIFKR